MEIEDGKNQIIQSDFNPQKSETQDSLQQDNNNESDKIQNEQVDDYVSLKNINLLSCIKNMQTRKQQMDPQILNRRYKKLKQLIDGDEYFSEEQIKLREPILYYLYCGQYRNMSKADPDAATSGFQDFLIERALEQDYQDKLQKEYEILKDKIDYPKLEAEEEITEEEIEDNQDELIRILHDKFICGYDTEQFNYEVDIDQNEQLDDIKEIENDLEEQYYDDQEITTDAKNSVYTGVQDF